MKIETQTQTTKTYTLQLTAQEAEDLRTLLHLAVNTLATAMPEKFSEQVVPGLAVRGGDMHRVFVVSGVQLHSDILSVEDELRLRTSGSV